MARVIKKGDTIRSRVSLKRIGSVVGVRDYCRCGGCGGMGVWVRWPDGKLTVNCTREIARDQKGANWKLRAA